MYTRSSLAALLALAMLVATTVALAEPSRVPESNKHGETKSAGGPRGYFERTTWKPETCTLRSPDAVVYVCSESIGGPNRVEYTVSCEGSSAPAPGWLRDVTLTAQGKLAAKTVEDRDFQATCKAGPDRDVGRALFQ